MLERQAMFKKLQELQMQKKLQEIKDAHQKDVMHNNHSSVLSYGVPVRDASQMFMFGDTNTVHGLPNRFLYSQAPMGLLPHFQTPVLSQGLHIGGQTRKPQKVTSQKLATLDPLEHNSLFNKTNKSSDFGCLESGSMSALMQSAVSDVSNGDSGSVLSFQNPDENQTSSMVESGKHYQTSWLYNKDYSGLSGFMDRSVVKKEDGAKWSTFEVKPGKGQQVTSSRRQSNIWVDVLPMQQNTPSTSYAANRKIELKTGVGQGSGKTHPRGNHGPGVKPMKRRRVVVKKERVDYENKSRPSSSSAANLSVKASVHQCGTNEVALKRPSSIYLKQYDVAKANMVVSKSRKRKVSKCEVTEGCSRLHDTRIAEVEWAHSVNRIPEADSLLNVDRKRRRLVLTTQLMQLLFRPSPKAVLSEDATKHCDVITYHVAKFGVDDACRSFKIIDDKQDLLKVVQGFIDRSKRIEDMLSRFEKVESSILDVKMEFQDLDKFSVISRFAKFHSRGPLVTSDTSSSGEGSTMQKPEPQKYVTASEMPSIVPEGQDCLLL